MTSSAELSKTETSATEDEEGKDNTAEEGEDNDEATKSGRFSVEKSKATPFGDTSKSPGTATSSSKQKSSGTGKSTPASGQKSSGIGKSTPASGQKSSGTQNAISRTAAPRSTVKTTQETSIGTATSLLYSTAPPSRGIQSPTYITVPSTAGTPTYVYVVPYTESGETSTVSSQLTSAISHITKGTFALTVSQAVKSKLTSTLQSTCESAQRSICAAMAKKEDSIEPECPIQTECPPSMQECYEDVRDRLCDVLTYDNIRDIWEKIWNGFLIMGGGYATERVKACKD